MSAIVSEDAVLVTGPADCLVFEMRRICGWSPTQACFVGPGLPYHPAGDEWLCIMHIGLKGAKLHEVGEHEVSLHYRLFVGDGMLPFPDALRRPASGKFF